MLALKGRSARVNPALRAIEERPLFRGTHSGQQSNRQVVESGNRLSSRNRADLEGPATGNPPPLVFSVGAGRIRQDPKTTERGLKHSFIILPSAIEGSCRDCVYLVLVDGSQLHDSKGESSLGMGVVKDVSLQVVDNRGCFLE